MFEFVKGKIIDIERIEKMESKKSDWATGTLKEVPFWREDMSVEEYEEERNYLNQHWTDYMNNRYIPLWKQKQTGDKK